MKIIRGPEEAINAQVLKPGRRAYVAGNAATPQILLRQIADDASIKGIDLIHVLLLGDLEALFTRECCSRITHRVIFNGPLTRKASNAGWAMYQLMHLSEIPRQLEENLQPDVAIISVSGPDNGGNFSLGTTVEAIPSAIKSVKNNGGVVIAERNAQMPFVLGTTIPGDDIDYLLDTDYPLPASPVHPPGERSARIGRIIAQRFIENGTTLQYGIGQVPEAVTDAILEKGVKNLGIHTELFADAMRRLIEAGAVSNRHTSSQASFSIAAIFLAGDQAGYRWLDFNSAIQSRPCNLTNNILSIAREPKMVSINSAIGVDLHGNIWADSLQARQIYSGVGGQADFIRGAQLSPGGVPIIALKSTTTKGTSKIVDKCPEGITTTAIAADSVVIVTEFGAFDPRGLSFAERAVAIAHLAEPAAREQLLKEIADSQKFHGVGEALRKKHPKGFISYESI